MSISTQRSKIVIGVLGLLCAAEAVYIITRLTRGVPADAQREANRPGVIYWHGPGDRSAVALTFDDGPSPYTPQLLAVLAEHGVKATFFLIGENVEKYPELARSIVAAGHVIGNHSYSHPNLNFETERRVGQQLARTNDIIFRVTGVKPDLFRPPFGDEDRFTLHEARHLGYISVDWSVSSKDWQRPGTDQIVANVLAHVHDGAIVLMHDGGGDRSQTVEAVAGLIPELEHRGYVLVTVPQLLGVPATFR